MAPQVSFSFNSSNLTAAKEYAPSVQEKIGYGTGMEKAARKFQIIILTLWLSSTVLIFSQRILLREKPFTIEIAGKEIIEISKPDILTENQVEHIDNILFTLNYTLVSYLMVLQFLPHGKVTN